MVVLIAAVVPVNITVSVLALSSRFDGLFVWMLEAAAGIRFSTRSVESF